MRLALCEPSADDLMRKSIAVVLKRGEHTEPTNGSARELQSVVLELSNPRARLSRSESRGRLFSALGELCWYLSGSNSTDFIAYYIDFYKALDEDGVIHGGYGPRLFAFDGVDQVSYVIERLRTNPYSRQAVVQLFDHSDVTAPHADVPCTCTLQFLVRAEKLVLISHMRSNDVYLGLPHDIFAFTMLQELVARSLGLDVGAYLHMVGSFHLYERNVDAAQAFLKEGWQGNLAMPAMPVGDPWPDVAELLVMEEQIRTHAVDAAAIAADGNPYWADLIRLLAIYSLWKDERYDEIDLMRKNLQSRVYDVFIADKTDGIRA